MKLLLWLLLLPLIVIFVAFAIANRHAVTLSFDPTPLSMDVPLYGIAFAGIFIGLVAVGIVAWWRAGRWRRQLRDEQRKVRRLENELNEARSIAPVTDTEETGTSIVKAA